VALSQLAKGSGVVFNVAGADRDRRAGTPDEPPTLLDRRSAAPRSSRGRELRIVGEDRLLELAQLGARLEAELVCQEGPAGSVRVEGVRLPSGAIQRQHQLRSPPLP
jgi:hypothetical protein